MTLLDLLYVPLALVTSPWWALRKRAGWGERFGKGEALPPKAVGGKPRVLLHAVSVGEVAALRTLVDLLLPKADVVVSATTDTGLARARELYAGKGVACVRYPLDFSWSVGRFLDRVKPDAVALVELEVWPQFVRTCAERGVPTLVINGRLSERSFEGYRKARWFFRGVLTQLDVIGTQNDAYAARFVALGTPSERCSVVGSMKWDNAAGGLDAGLAEGADALARELGIDRSRPLIVAGSTAEDEEALLLRNLPEGAQLLCAPRKPEHFDDAARALPGCVRRSEKTTRAGAHLFLLDTIGELRRAYALADVVVIGRSFGALYGSDPMEPAGLGKPLLIGPRFGDFADAAEVLRASGGLRVVTREELGGALRELVSDAGRRERMGAAARETALGQRGASARYAEMILRHALRRGA